MMENKRFPRGGKINNKTSSSSDKSSHTAFFKSFCAQKSTKKTKNIKSNKKKSGKDVKNKKNVQTKVEKKPEADVVLEGLRQEDLETHLLVLGRVAQVQQSGLLMSLPGLLSGHVPLIAVSAPYTKLLGSESEECPALSAMFTEGQYLSCMVTSIDLSGEKVKNTLSISPRDINASLPDSCLAPGLVLQCAIRSEEDHAYDMDAGMLNTRAILPKASQQSSSTPFLVGQVIWCVVDSVASADGLTTLTLSRQPGRFNSSEIPADSPINSQTLLPGMQLSVSITAVVSGGLQVSWQNSLPAYVTSNHLSTSLSVPSDYSTSQRHRATVLYTLPVLRRTFLCLRSRLLDQERQECFSTAISWRGPATARVLDVTPAGVRLSCAESEERVLFCPGWGVLSPQDGGRWRVGMETQCWPIKYSHMEDVCVVSMRTATVINPVASYTPGQKVSGKVIGSDSTSLSIRLKEGRMAVLPRWLTGRVSPVIGSKVRVRVLSLRRTGMVVVVAVPRVVEGSAPLAVDDGKGRLEVGGICWWLVEKSVDGGLLLCGYGETRAFLPTHSASAVFLATCAPGRLLHCRVKSITSKDSKQRRITVEALDEPGSCLRGAQQLVTVLHREETGLTVSLEDGSEAYLPQHHLTDVPELADRALSLRRPGDSLSVIVLGRHDGRLEVSAKPRFLRALESGSWPCEPSELEAGMVLPCSVRESARQDAVLVEFPCAALPRTLHIRSGQLGTGWQQQQGRHLAGKTLLATLVSVADGKFVLSARVTDEERRSGSWLSHCLAELAALRVTVSPSVGEQVQAEVLSRQKHGLQLKIVGFEGPGLLPNALQEPDTTPGSSLTVSALYVTIGGVLVVSARHRTASCSVRPRQSLARAEVVSEEAGLFAVAVLMPPAPQHVVFISKRSGFNDITPPAEKTSVCGGQVTVKITGLENGVLVAHLSDRRAPGGKFSKRSGGSFKHPGTKRPAFKSPVGRSRKKINYSRFSLVDDE